MKWNEWNVPSFQPPPLFLVENQFGILLEGIFFYKLWFLIKKYNLMKAHWIWISKGKKHTLMKCRVKPPPPLPHRSVTVSPPILSSALWDSGGLDDCSLEEVTPSVSLLSPNFVALLLDDFGVFVGVLLGDLLVVVFVAVSPTDGFLLSWSPLVNFSCWKKTQETNNDK